LVLKENIDCCNIPGIKKNDNLLQCIGKFETKNAQVLVAISKLFDYIIP